MVREVGRRGNVRSARAPASARDWSLAKSNFVVQDGRVMKRPLLLPRIFSLRFWLGIAPLLVAGALVAGCPAPAPGGQSDACAVMMKCWYDVDALIERAEDIPIDVRDGGSLTESDLVALRAHFGFDGACWRDADLGIACDLACIEALRTNCEAGQPQCLSADRSAFAPGLAVGDMQSCTDIPASVESP